MATTTTKLDLDAILDLFSKAGINVNTMLDRVEAELDVKYGERDYIPLPQIESIVAQHVTSSKVMAVVGLVAKELPAFFKSGKSAVKKRRTRWA